MESSACLKIVLDSMWSNTEAKMTPSLTVAYHDAVKALKWPSILQLPEVDYAKIALMVLGQPSNMLLTDELTCLDGLTEYVKFAC